VAFRMEQQSIEFRGRERYPTRLPDRASAGLGDAPISIRFAVPCPVERAAPRFRLMEGDGC
jgi:hypothetical protein